jgi:hypothetical protein
MASSRKTGVNEGTPATYGDATRDYQVGELTVWEQATDINLVTGTISYVLECYDDAASFNDNVTLAGATTNSSYFRIIRPAGVKGEASWQGHDGTPNNGFTIQNTTDTTAIIINEANTQVQDLIAINAINSATVRNSFSLQNAGSFVGCIAKSTNAGSGTARGFGVASNGGGFLINCLAYECELMGFDFGVVVSQTMTAYNCTAYGNGNTGFNIRLAVAGTVVLTNCLSTANVTKDFSSADTVNKVFTYCASEDLTADDWGGAGNITEVSVTFANAAGDDYHLASTDTDVINQGTSLSGTFTDDVDFETRDANWDIGFDEYVATLATIQSATFSTINPIVSTTTSIEVSPSIQTATFSVPTPTIESGGTIEVIAGIQSATFSQPTAVISATKNIESIAAVQTAIYSQPTAIISITRNVNQSPAVQTATFSIISPNLTLGDNEEISAGVQSVTFSQPVAVVSITRNTSQSPTVLTSTFSIISPAITEGAGMTVAPNVESATFTIPAPNVSGELGIIVSAAIQEATFSQPTATVTTGFEYYPNDNLLLDIGGSLVMQLSRFSMPTWNIEGRPDSPKRGDYGFNTETDAIETYDGSGWN